MRIVHVAPRLTRTAAEPAPAVRLLAAAQALVNGGNVQVVGIAPSSRRTRHGDLELLSFAADRPAWLGRSRGLRHHLAGHPLELLHAHCPGEHALHRAHVAAQSHGAPLVISPAGAFGFGARDRIRARCACQRLFIHPRALEQASGWHATSAEEAAAIRACGFRQPICVAPPGVLPPAPETLATARAEWIQRYPALAGRPVALCFAPRGGAGRLRALLSLWAAQPRGEWLLLVVTPGDSASLPAQVARLGAADRILIAPTGSAPPSAVAQLSLEIGDGMPALRRVAENLAAGVPALVAGDAPWRRLDADGAGWWVPWANLGPALARIVSLPPEELAAFSRRAGELARREFTWARAAEQLLAFYRNLRG